MSITLLGSCRINGIRKKNDLNTEVNFTHTTKEAIQLIKFYKGELAFPEPYNLVCFRTAIVENKPILYNPIFTQIFNKSKIVVVEICSSKKYIHNNFYLHHLCVDKRFAGYHILTPPEILNNFTLENQSNEEIENDILEINQLIYPKKLIIVSHYNGKVNGKFIESRNKLINLLENICARNHIHFIDPTKALDGIKQNKVIDDDLGHYTEKGRKKLSRYFNKYIRYNFPL